MSLLYVLLNTMCQHFLPYSIQLTGRGQESKDVTNNHESRSWRQSAHMPMLMRARIIMLVEKSVFQKPWQTAPYLPSLPQVFTTVTLLKHIICGIQLAPSFFRVCTCLSESSRAADCQWICSKPSEKQMDQSGVWTAKHRSAGPCQQLHMLLLWGAGMSGHLAQTANMLGPAQTRNSLDLAVAGQTSIKLG